jgi:hypothetical protein
MNDKDKTLQHAMTSFAFWGGMMVNSGRYSRGGDRMVSPRTGAVPMEMRRAR